MPDSTSRGISINAPNVSRPVGSPVALFTREPTELEIAAAKRAMMKLRPDMGDFAAAEIVTTVIDALRGKQ